MTVRVVVVVVLFAVLCGVAWWLERRRGRDVPTQTPRDAPTQLDRSDFPSPQTPWLVVLFTSATCDSCAGLYDKALALASDEVAVVEVEYFTEPELHDRYHIDAAPMTLVADADGVVRKSFVGAFAAPELWATVAELRAAE